MYYPNPEEKASWTKYVAACVRHNISSAVYNTDREPVAWSIHHLYGSGGMGNTRPDHRSMNLFDNVARHMAKELLQCSWDNFGYTAFDNLGGQTLAAKHGMDRVGIGGHRFYHPFGDSKL